MSQIELSVRTFFTCDEADIAPRVALVVDHSKLGETDWPKVVEGLRTLAMGQIEGGPFTNVREMTKDEITAYRADEAHV